MIETIRIPAFNDNYIWLMVEPNTKTAAVIDPGTAQPVLETLKKHHLNLTAILITHHHLDHRGGIPELLEHFDIPVYEPYLEQSPHCTHPVHQDDIIRLKSPNITLSVIEIPGHTLGHVAYVGDGKLFCGDTLFTGGCGRLFEGSPEQMLNSLQKLKALPPETDIYCGHEYTQANLGFALTIEKNNADLLNRYHDVLERRARGEATVPSSLDLELKTNPFCRTHTPEVIQAANRLSGKKIVKESDIFYEIRKSKDKYFYESP